MRVPKKGWKTAAIGTTLAFFGTVFAFLNGVDWSVVFTPEAAAVAGAGIVFGRAVVAFFQSRGL